MKAIIKEIISLSLYLAIILGCTYLLVNYVLQRTEIEGDSMQPTLSDGDNIIVDKLTYRFKEPQRYDIIAFPYRYEQDTYFVKRIIGLPGEKVRIDAHGIIFINDEALDERYGTEPIHQARDAFTPRILGEDEYFVLGDNRNDSMDSRDSSVGLVRREEIIGRAFVRIYPFTSIGFIQNKKSSSEPEAGENK
ncbi:MAG: signal peptidase I [Eubacterium sp.]|nr:signal peptidase I [Eubacterium sp.]